MCGRQTHGEDGLLVETVLAECSDCKNPSTFQRYDYGDGFGAYNRIHPPSGRQLNFAVPRIVRSSFNEAVKCEACKAWTASVVMVGRTLEAVITNIYPDIRIIYQGLRKLKDDGIISDEIFRWADSLRFLRNIGAHANDVQISAEDAADSIDFLQAILEIMFHLRPRFEAMMARRNP